MNTTNKCRNYNYCQAICTKWSTENNQQLCVQCTFQLGDHIYTNQIEECCVCFNKQPMLILPCEHQICNDCWFKITARKTKSCPLCRNYNQFSR